MFKDNSGKSLSLEEAIINSSLPRDLHSLDLDAKRRLVALKRRRPHPLLDETSEQTLAHWRFLQFYEKRTGHLDTKPAVVRPRSQLEMRGGLRKFTIPEGKRR